MKSLSPGAESHDDVRFFPRIASWETIDAHALSSSMARRKLSPRYRGRTTVASLINSAYSLRSQAFSCQRYEIMKNLIVAFVSIFAIAYPTIPASPQVYPVPGKVCCAHDVIMAFIPKRSDAQRIMVWTGTIQAYRVVDETVPEGLPQRTEIDFQQDGDTNRYTIYLTSPLRINGRVWHCDVPTSTSVYRHDYNICPTLPTSIKLAKTHVRVSVWFVKSQLYNGAFVPASDNIAASVGDV